MMNEEFDYCYFNLLFVPLYSRIYRDLTIPVVLSVLLCVFLFCPSVLSSALCLSVFGPLYCFCLAVCLSVCLSVCLYVCLSPTFFGHGWILGLVFSTIVGYGSQTEPYVLGSMGTFSRS